MVKLDWANAAKQLAGLPVCRSNPARCSCAAIVPVPSTGSNFGPGRSLDRATRRGLPAWRSPAVARRLPRPLNQLRDAVAPLDLYLDSSRGRYPTYHVGDQLEFVLQTNRDAYLYCMIRDRDGHLSPLFPWHSSQARIAGHQTLNLPGRSLLPALRASTELNGSEIRCFASERDLATELPLLAGASSGDPLPEDTAMALDRAIADSSRQRVVMAQLILRIEE